MTIRSLICRAAVAVCEALKDPPPEFCELCHREEVFTTFDGYHLCHACWSAQARYGTNVAFEDPAPQRRRVWIRAQQSGAPAVGSLGVWPGWKR